MSLSIRPMAWALGALVLLSLILVPSQAAAGAATLGAIDVWGHDVDEDGLIDMVQLNVTVDVTAPGVLTVVATSSAGNQPYGDTAYLDVGTHILHAYIRGFFFYNWGGQGPYALTVMMFDTVAGLLGTTVVYTPAWKPSDFPPPGARLVSMEAPWFRDTDGNGRYDTLQVNLTLNTTVSAEYKLVTMVNNPPNSKRFYLGEPVTLALGVSARILSVDTSAIVSLGIDGPYTVTVSVQSWYGTSGDVLSSLSAVTAAMTHDAFDGPWAWIRTGVTDDGVDRDGDGLNESVVIHVPVHLGRPGTATVNGTLHLGTFDIPEDAPPVALPAGDWNVDLAVSADLLRNLGAPGPYQVDLGLRMNELPFFTNATRYTTRAYRLADMGGPSARITSVTYGPMDTDSDGVADFFQVNQTVVVTKPGDFFLTSLFYTPAVRLPAARYVQLDAGTHVLSQRLSGIPVNRSGLTTFISEIIRLDASPWDTSAFAASVNSPPAERSRYEFRYPETLSGTIQCGSGLPPDALVYALNPEDGFLASTQTALDGSYSLPVYNGTFILFMQPSSYPNEPTAIGVTVDGPTVQDALLPTMAPRGVTYDVVMSAWNVSSMTVGMGYGGMSTVARVLGDLYGNFDGVANATELGWYARYTGVPPLPGNYASAYGANRGAGVTLRVDGQELTPGDSQFVSAMNGGPVLPGGAVSVVLQTAFHGPAIPVSDSHIVSVNLPADQAGYDARLTLRLPSDALWSDGTASPSVNLTLISAPSQLWLANPTPPFADFHVSESAWITTSVYDHVPPVAVASGPAVGERGDPVTFRSNGSSDRDGITNRTWTVEANGSHVHGYGEAFEWTPTQIGSFDVRVRVRDVEGLESDDNLTLHVVDTRAPPAPTGLSAMLRNDAGGPVVDLVWSSVAADDLKVYRVYRSADNGSTFGFLGWSDGPATRFTDAAAASGGTFLYRVTAADRYGNEGTASLTAQVTVPVPGGSPGPVDVFVWVGLAATVIAVACVAAYVVLRRRRAVPPPKV